MWSDVVISQTPKIGGRVSPNGYAPRNVGAEFSDNNYAPEFSGAAFYK